MTRRTPSGFGPDARSHASTQQSRLFLSGQGFRFADVDLRRLESQGGLGHGVEDVDAGCDQQANRTSVALGQRDDGRQQALLVVGRPRVDRRIIRDIDADDANGHHDHVAIARRVQCGLEMRRGRAASGPARADCPAALPPAEDRPRARATTETRRVSGAAGWLAPRDARRSSSAAASASTSTLPANVPASGTARTATDGTTTNTPASHSPIGHTRPATVRLNGT